MDFGLSEEQEMLKKMARDFLQDNCPKPAAMFKDLRSDERGYPPALWKGMAELGWMGLAFPEKYGGAGGSFLDLTVILEEMGRACLPGPFFATVVLAGEIIQEAGTEKQKQDLLSGIAKGDLVFTAALLEEDGKYEAGAIKATAAVSGDSYVINGTKLFVPSAHVADYIICAAKSEEGMTLFLVDGKAKGLKTTVMSTIDWSKLCAVTFENVKVPKQNVIGQPGKGCEILGKVLMKAKVGTCADAIGCAGRAMEMAVEYAKTRVQFGVIIGTFEVLQHYCAGMAIALEAGRWATYKSAWLIAQGKPAEQWVAMAKSFVSPAVQESLATAVHVHGSIGMTVDHDMPLYFARAKALELAFGGADENLELVARTIGL